MLAAVGWFAYKFHALPSIPGQNANFPLPLPRCGYPYPTSPHAQPRSGVETHHPASEATVPPRREVKEAANLQRQQQR